MPAVSCRPAPPARSRSAARTCFPGTGATPDATAEALRDGWYFSGDVGMRDDDGYFFVHDRKKNLIISGGENVYPAEIERVLLTHPSVAEAAVIGRPDPKWQEVPAAYVVLRAGMSADAATLKAHVAGELARFKVPRDVVFVDSLPRNVMGKVQHFRLRDATADAPKSAGCGAAKCLSRLAAAFPSRF